MERFLGCFLCGAVVSRSDVCPPSMVYPCGGWFWVGAVGFDMFLGGMGGVWLLEPGRLADGDGGLWTLRSEFKSRPGLSAN